MLNHECHGPSHAKWPPSLFIKLAISVNKLDGVALDDRPNLM